MESKGKKFKCSEEGCKKKFTLKTNLVRHLKTHDGYKKVKIKKIFVCTNSWCSKEMNSNFNLERHKKTCLQPKKEKLKCEVCKKEFSKLSNKIRHVKTNDESNKKKKRNSDSILKVKITKKKKTDVDNSIPCSMVFVEEIVNDVHVSEDSAPLDIGLDLVMGYMFEDMVGMYNEAIDKDMLDLHEDNEGNNSDNKETEEGSNEIIEDCETNNENDENSGNEVDNESDADGDEYEEDNEEMVLDLNEVNKGHNFEEQEIDVDSSEKNCDCEPNNENDENSGNEVDDESDEDEYEDEEDNEEDERANTDYRLRTAKHLCAYIKKEIRMSRFRLKKKIDTAKFILKVFKKDLEDMDFICYLSKEFGFKVVEDFTEYLKCAKSIAPTRGRKSTINKELVRKMYEFWKKNSIISVDRRNERNFIKRKPKKVLKLCRDIQDSNIESFTDAKGRTKLKGHRHIYTKTVKHLYNAFILESGESVSETTFFYTKPFYIQAPSTREMESCTCIDCVNPHYLYSAIKRKIKKLTGKVLPDSLTKYLTSNFTCNIDEEIGYHDLSCIQGTCKNECTIKLDTVANNNKVYTYIKFKPTVTTYYNTSGKKVEYTRCARSDERATPGGMLNLLEGCAKKYLMHRYFVSMEKAFWPRFKSNAPCPIIHIDYSENIKLTPKNEVQSAHFSGRQHTLHCSVLFNSSNNGDHQFVYHLSDDTNHDSVLTSKVILDIIQKYPQILESGYLVVRSDNMRCQYKCKYVFAQMKNIAKKYLIDIFWFYGAPGHGRGLVDAMSSFGCKAPMRRAIITENKFFNDVQEMQTFLIDEFEKDPQKMSKAKKAYHIIKQEHTAKIRRRNRPEHVIKNSSQKNLIAVSSSGTWMTKVVLKVKDENVMKLKIVDTEFDTDIDTAVNELEEDENRRNLEDIEGVSNEWHGNEVIDNNETIVDISTLDVKFDMIKEDTFVGLLTPTSGFESFYLVKVVEKGISKEKMEDNHGHAIYGGQKYIIGTYYEKDREAKKCIFYKKSKNFDNVLIHINEITCVNIEFDGAKMSTEEYVSVCNEIFH